MKLIFNITMCVAAPCLLDVMQIDLVSMDLYAGLRNTRSVDKKKPLCALELGLFCVHKKGPSLLREKCELKIQVERNLDSHLSHEGTSGLSLYVHLDFLLKRREENDTCQTHVCRHYWGRENLVR